MRIIKKGDKMNVIVCIDDNKGMLFNQRRQSKDMEVVKDIWRMTDVLWIAPFSKTMFEDSKDKVIIDEELLEKANNGEYCFVENKELAPFCDDIEQLVLYKWNRKYPCDFRLDIQYEKWNLVRTQEFVGNSHEKVTKEIYVRG